MFKQQLLPVLLILAVSGCAAFKKTDNDPAPEDFIVRQNSTQVSATLNALTDENHAIRFERGSTAIPEQEQEKILQWINIEQPKMIAVRGTAGAEKYRDLGNSRANSTIQYLISQSVGVDVILLDYDATLSGGRAVIHSLSAALSEQIRENAPILIIKTN